MATASDNDCLTQINKYPCAFNLENTDRIARARLKATQHNLLSDADLDNWESEQVRNNNLLTWIYYRLEKEDKAVEMSNNVIELTHWKNISSLGNRFFIMWGTGNKLEAKTCLELLEKMKEEDNFFELLTEAKAEQAYYYRRLGGPANLKLAIRLFSEALLEIPDIYVWTFDLGLTYRRATHANIFCSSNDHMNIEEWKKKAIEYLFKVADNADSCLQAMAYAQLVILRQNDRHNPQFNALFRYLSVQKLCDKALENGGEIASVLTHCGKVMRGYDIDKSICLLEKSVGIKARSNAYHYLGKSYVRKAELIARKSYKPREESWAHRQSFHHPTNIRGSDRQSFHHPTNIRGSDRQSFHHPTNIRGSDRQSFHHPTNIRGSDRQSFHHPTNIRGSDRQSFHPPTNIRGSDRQSFHPPTNIRGSDRQLFPQTIDGSGLYRQSFHQPMIVSGSHRYPFHQPTNVGQWFHQPVDVRGSHRQSFHQPMEVRGSHRKSFHQPMDVRGSHRQSFHEPTDVRGSHRQYFHEPTDVRGSHRQSFHEPTDVRGPYRQLLHKCTQESRSYGQTFYDQSDVDGSFYEPTGVRGSHERNIIGGDCNFLGKNTFSRSVSSDSAAEEGPAYVHENHRRGSGMSSGALHQSGRGREIMSRYKGTSRECRASISEGCLPQTIIGCYLPKPRTVVLLNKDDDLIKKAFECFERAVDIAKVNYPALLDLGILLKRTGQIEKALVRFNKMTGCIKSAQIDHRLTIISAFEQAGLCYLELSKSATCDKSYEDEGKRKLTTAVSLAADLAVIMPELKDSAQEFWAAFRTLESEIDRESPSPSQQKNKIKLLELARDYGQTIEVLKKLREYSEDQLNDKDIIKTALNCYLNLEQVDNALAFQNLVGMRPDIKDCTWWTTGPLCDLRFKVLLLAVSTRLIYSMEHPSILYQQLFKLSFGRCCGLCAHENDEHLNPTEDVPGDVLILYDGDYDCEESPSPTMKSARCLKEIANSMFGLEAEENLKGCGEYGDYIHVTQIKEMRRYQVVMIVLGSEIRDDEFETILKCCHKKLADLTNQRIVIIDAGLKDGQVPGCLDTYACLKLDDIGGLGDLPQVPAAENDSHQLTVEEILTHAFHGDVDAIMKLFCFMIGQHWPCP